jgi:hypothetical protein
VDAKAYKFRNIFKEVKQNERNLRFVSKCDGLDLLLVTRKRRRKAAAQESWQISS